jgi:outer membrane protein
MVRQCVTLALGAVLVTRPAVAQAPDTVRLSFADAVRRAAASAPAVALAGAATDAAQARVRETRAALLPGVSASGGWLNRTFNVHSLGIEIPSLPGQAPYPDLIGPYDTWDTRFQVQQALLDLSGFARTGAARAQVRSAEADSGASSETAAQRAALAYLAAARASAQVAARVADSSIAAELLDLAQAQKTAGVSAAIDVTRAEAQLVTARGRLVVARNASARASLQVARALGLDPATPVALADSLSAELGAADVPAEPAQAVALGLARRPDLAAAEARGDAARRAVSAIRAERLPRVDLAADYGLNGPQVGSMIRTGQVGVEVTLPILDGWRHEGRRAEQEAAARAADIRAHDLAQEIAAEVDAAFLDIGAAQAQSGIAAEGLRLAEQELSQARERFRAGVAGNIEVIDAQAALVRARDGDIDARYAAAAARVALARAVGEAHTLH